MTLHYRAITANCDNDTLGKVATGMIAEELKHGSPPLDFCVINCQEVNYAKTLAALKAAMGPGYSVTLIGSMDTKTKIDTLLGGTGMASFIIAQHPEVSVFTNSTTEARRNPKTIGTAYNKGGLISNCIIHTQHDSIQLQCVSGHLDSTKTKERTQDWIVIQSQLARPSSEITSFEQLAEAIPNLRLSGYDANTRNRMDDGKPLNLWTSDDLEIRALTQAPLGNARFSADSTYKTHKPGIETTADLKKRVGYTKGGMLDFVDVLDGQSSTGITTEEVTVVHSDDKSTKRDHAVIISPTKSYTSPLSAFDRVKYQMAAMLEKAAPNLAQDLRDLPQKNKNKQLLVEVYRHFLSQEGVLLKELNLYMHTLGNNPTASSKSSSLQSESLQQQTTAWFEDVRLGSDYSTQLLKIIDRQIEDERLLAEGLLRPVSPGSLLTDTSSEAFTSSGSNDSELVRRTSMSEKKGSSTRTNLTQGFRSLLDSMTGRKTQGSPTSLNNSDSTDESEQSIINPLIGRKK